MGDLNAIDLIDIEARLDAFGEWFAGIIEGAAYDRTAAMEDWKLLEIDQRRLIEQVRARA